MPPAHMTLRPRRPSRPGCCGTCDPPAPRAASIADLSDEILLHVFAHLDKSQLLSAVPLVSRRWRRLYADPCLYRSLHFRGDAPDTRTALRLLRMSPWLRRLHLANRWDADRILPHVRRYNANLETLVMHNVKGHHVRMFIDATMLRSVVHHCAGLRTLSLNRTFCGTEAFHRTVDIATQPLSKAIHFDSYTEVSFTAHTLMANTLLAHTLQANTFLAHT